MVFEGLDIFTTQPTRISVEEGRLSRVERLPGLSHPGRWLSPGFLDIQVNGYKGRDYSSPQLSLEDVRGITLDLAGAGTLRHFPTIITSAKETILRNLDLISSAVIEDESLGLAIPGIHLEGPFLSPQDGARGAHSLRYIRNPDIAELEAWHRASRGLLRVVTLAAEAPGAVPFIQYARNLGITVALGHSLASREQIIQAVEAGATLSTHLGNGSPALLPRLNNPIWAQLANDGLTASIISDGYHLPEDVLKVFSRAKGLKRLVLVSDVGTMGGLAPGRYTWGDTLVEVAPSGRLGVADTEYLAGAGHLLDRCLMVFMQATGLSLQEVFPLVSSQPASLVGLQPAPVGFVEGAMADLICFEPGDQQLKVFSAVRGKERFQFL